MRPKTYLFPGTSNGWRADKPITPKVVWEAVQEATQRAGITKHVTPHTLRHCFASHLLAARFGILHHLSEFVHSKANCP